MSDIFFGQQTFYEAIVRVYKTILFSVVILLIAVLFAGAVTVPAAAQYDAMQFRYNAQHTGHGFGKLNPLLL
jgi:hypothetical protein